MISSTIYLFQTKNKQLESSLDLGFLSKESNNSLLVFEFIPNSEGYIAGAYTKINSQGFRDYEYSKEKETNVFRIIIIGDSFTFGYGVKLEDSYPKILEEILNHKSDKKFEVLNFGGLGWNTIQEAEIFRTKVLEYNPDLVIFGYFINDAEGDHEKDINYCSNNIEIFKKNKLENKNNYYQRINELINRSYSNLKNITALESTDIYYPKLYEENKSGWICTQEGFQRIKSFSEETNISILFVMLPAGDDEFSFNILELTKLTIESYDITTIDLSKVFIQGIKNGNFNSSNVEELFFTKIWPEHYNKEGNLLIAKEISDKLTNIVKFK